MDEQDRRNFLMMAPAVIWSAPVAGVRLVVSYLRIKRTARKAVRHFGKGLEQSGIPHEVAQSLRAEFDENTSLFRQMTSMMTSFAFNPK